MDAGVSNATLDGRGRPLSDAILMKTALEGKDFQTARKEVAEAAEAASVRTSSAPDEQPLEAPEPTPAFRLEVESVQVTTVAVEVRTPERSLSFEATRIEAQRVLVQVGPSPRRGSAPAQDPLVLDFGGSGPETTGAEGARPFDLAGDGDGRPTSFVTGGTAFLALDRNGNGRIDDGRELFGDQHGAVDGYAELARFDDNGDRWIDGQDRVYGSLRLLFGDGRQSSLAEAGVLALQVEGVATSARTTGGDEVFKRAVARTVEGGTLSSYALNLQRFDLQA